MGNKADKAPNDYPIGTKDLTDTLGRNGRSIFAERLMINNEGFEDISNLTADLIPLPTSDVEMEAVSDSAQDGPGGSGALTVLVVALNSQFVENFQIITLGGGTPQPVLTSTGSGVRRINSFLVQSVGTERGAAVGTIVIRDKNAPATIFSQIDPGENSSAQSLRTVPANTSVSFTGWYASSGATVAKTMKFRFQTTFNEPGNEVTPGVFTTRDIIILRTDQVYKPFPVPFVIPAGTDLIINAQLLEGGTGNASVSYQYFIQR